MHKSEDNLHCCLLDPKALGVVALLLAQLKR